MNHRYKSSNNPVVLTLLSIFACFANSAVAQTYCLPGNSDCSQSDEILNVKFGTINNSSICDSSSSNGYSDFTTLAAPGFAPGAVADLSVTINNAGGDDNSGAWIDFNKNGIFEAAEFFYIGVNNTNGPLELIKSITIPAGAVQGLTRMRIRVRYGNVGVSATDFCTTYGVGETEDYTINITTCKGPSAAVISADTAFCKGGIATLRVIGGTLGDATEWKWYSNSCGGSPAGTGTSITVTPTVTTTYYVRGEGGCVLPASCSPVKVTVTTIPGIPRINPITPFCENQPGLLVINPFTLSHSPDSITVASGPLTINIPDNTENGVTADIVIPTLPPGAQITGIDVTINMTHTYIGDMIFNLKAPNGTIIALDKYLGGTGNDGEDFINTVFSSLDTASLAYGTAPFSARFAPDAYNGFISGPDVQNPIGYESTADSFPQLYSIAAGRWVLAMADGGLNDLGQLKNWSIKIKYDIVKQVVSFPAVWSPAASLYTDAAATVPYNGTTPLFQVYAKPAVSTIYTAVSQNGGCVSTPATVLVTVNIPVAITSQPAAVAICEFGTVSFSADAKGTTPAYQWLLNTGSGVYTAITDNSNYAGTATKTLTIKNAPASWNNYKYRVAVASAAPCTTADTSAEALLTINPTPVISLTAAPITRLLPGLSSTIMASSSPAAATFSWYRNGAVVQAATGNSISVSIDELGEYKAMVTDINGCTGTSAGLTIADSVSGKLFVFPNPNTGQFQVRYYSVSGNVLPRTLMMYDSKGALVLNKTYTVGKPYDKMEVNFNSFSKGVYMINLLDLTGKRLAAGKVVIQ